MGVDWHSQGGSILGLSGWVVWSPRNGRARWNVCWRGGAGEGPLHIAMATHRKRRFLEGNTAFRRSALAISDPVVIGAILLMLLNDHVLKHLWTSWWTGKLSDVTWVVFAPVLVALLISWVVPWGAPRQPRIVALLSFGMVGIAYGLFNQFQGFHDLSLRALSAMTGEEVVIQRDATDNLTLPGLVVGWWVWWRQDTGQSLRRLRRGLGSVVAVIAVLAMIGSQGSPNDYGITFVAYHGGSLSGITAEYRDAYVSDSDGLTWRKQRERRVLSPLALPGIWEP